MLTRPNATMQRPGQMRRFGLYRSHFTASLAQSAEQLTLNQLVSGSSPEGGTFANGQIELPFLAKKVAGIPIPFTSTVVWLT